MLPRNSFFQCLWIILVFGSSYTRSHTSISSLKCMEYGGYVYEQEEGVALLNRRMYHTVSRCRSEVPLVVGGERAMPMEFPHMAAIGYGPQSANNYQCGGSLISEQYILTAAHCRYSPDGIARWAKLGALDIQMTPASNLDTQVIMIDQIIVHPGFKPPVKYDDIALMKMIYPAKINGNVRPACLPSVPGNMYQSGIATGWGKQNQADFVGSGVLMKVRLSIFQDSYCANGYDPDDFVDAYALPSGILPSQMCAGYVQGGKDTCHGDSGGPLQVMLESPYCMYSIVGITSFGKSCGAANTPAIYTNVYYYLPWIESIVWGNA